MKTETLVFIQDRIKQCRTTMAAMEEVSPESKKTKLYWGISQELNCLERILRMEDIKL